MDVSAVPGVSASCSPPTGGIEARLVAIRRRLALAAAGAFLAKAATGAALHDRLGDALLTGHAPEAVAWRIGQGVTGCLLVGAVLGALGARTAPTVSDRAAPMLAWARVVALPVYLVHQTVGVVCAYVLLQWGLPAGAALPLLVIATTGLSVLLAETLRRTPLRAAFGMARPRPAATRARRDRAEPAAATA